MSTTLISVGEGAGGVHKRIKEGWQIHTLAVHLQSFIWQGHLHMLNYVLCKRLVLPNPTCALP